MLKFLKIVVASLLKFLKLDLTLNLFGFTHNIHISILFWVLILGGTFLQKIGYFFCILFAIMLHECSHAYVAKLFNYPCKRIVYHAFGGTALLDMPIITPPKHEFLIALAGPVCSLSLFGTYYLFTGYLADSITNISVWAFFFHLNLVIGALNLCVTVYPLDGGRVLKSLLALCNVKALYLIPVISACSSFLAIYYFNMWIALLIFLLSWFELFKFFKYLNQPVSTYATIITKIKSNGKLINGNVKLKEIYSSWARGTKYFTYVDGVICEVAPDAK